jgi:hypothetical protein
MHGRIHVATGPSSWRSKRARKAARRFRAYALVCLAAGVLSVGGTDADVGSGRAILNARNATVTDHDAMTIVQVGGGITNTGSAPVQFRLNTLSSEDQAKIQKLMQTKGALPSPSRSDSTKYDITGLVDGVSRTIHRVPEELVPSAVRSLIKPELPKR